MAGDLSFDIDKKTKSVQEYRQKIGPDKFDTFAAKYAWMDGAKYISHAAPAAMFLQYATDEPFLNGELAKQYFEIVSEPKKLKIYIMRRTHSAPKPPVTASLSSRSNSRSSRRTPKP
jgi:hypothetical protein